MKSILQIIFAVLIDAVMGTALAFALGVNPAHGAIAGILLGIVISCTPRLKGVARAGVLKEIWTGEVVKTLREFLSGSWLDGIPDQSAIVDNDVIHLVEVGVDPDVLINNTTYPIPLQVLEDKDIAISLDKFQTKVTPVTDDELYALSYDKMARVKESHANAIADAKFAKAAHALCAQKHTATTPVLQTTGAVDEATGRKRMTIDDLVSLKASMDALGVPTVGRRLVLCPDHVNDLLRVEQTFREMYNINRNDGTIGRLYGFDIYTFGNNPVYTAGGEKKAVNAAPEAGEFQCSFAFYERRIFKATGSTKMYYSEASTDPEYQRNKINFTHRFICMPKRQDAGVVMISATETPRVVETPREPDTPSNPETENPEEGE